METTPPYLHVKRGQLSTRHGVVVVLTLPSLRTGHLAINGAAASERHKLTTAIVICVCLLEQEFLKRDLKESSRSELASCYLQEAAKTWRPHHFEKRARTNHRERSYWKYKQAQFPSGPV